MKKLIKMASSFIVPVTINIVATTILVLIAFVLVNSAASSGWLLILIILTILSILGGILAIMDTVRKKQVNKSQPITVTKNITVNFGILWVKF